MKGNSFYDSGMKKMRYFDKHGVEIHEGDVIKHDNGETETIYICGDGDDLGVSASNETYLARHPEASRECYPLTQFDMNEWEIVE